MNAAIISMGSTSSQWTVESMKKYFSTVDELNVKNIEVHLGKKGFEILHNGEPLKKYDCIYAKGSYKFAALLRSITAAIAHRTFMPIKASAFTVGHDKLLTHLKLQQNGIPMPGTYLAATVNSAKSLLESMNYPLVMKFPQGTHGKGVMFADSLESATSILDALSALNQPFIIQEYIETGGEDIRAIVVGDKVVAAMKRRVETGEKRANLHAGAVGESLVLDGYTQRIAVRAAQAIGAHVCGVDIIEGPKGPLIIEINLSPGLQGISEITHVDVADRIAQYLHNQAKEAKTVKKKSGASRIMEDLGIGEALQNKRILSRLDFRGERILLPEHITGITKFDEKSEVSIKALPGELTIRKESGKPEEE